MTHKLLFSLLLVLSSVLALGQQPRVVLRIADSLTPEEKKMQNRVILRSELDSFIFQYEKSRVKPVEKPAVVEQATVTNDNNLVYSIIIMLLVGGLGFIIYRQQLQINRKLDQLKPEKKVVEPSPTPSNTKRSKTQGVLLEGKIEDLKTELYRLSKENESLNRVIKEYNGIQHEYESLKHGILKTYKVKNYPGYDKNKDENSAMQSVLSTESSVAVYAYEKFLKPILAITDANKNSPARMAAADREKLLDLLISLSLLYIEYLYLRVHELSIGGKMVERIQGLSKGNSLDISLLKKLDTDFGSRALVIKMALDGAGLHDLKYPVFDETNLNHQ